MPKRAFILLGVALIAGVSGFAMSYLIAQNSDALGLPQDFPAAGIETTLASPGLACGRFKLAVEADRPGVRISPSPGVAAEVNSGLLVERSRRAITIIAKAQSCSYRLTIEKDEGADDGFTLL